MSALFPDHADVLVISTTPVDNLGYELAGRVRLRECQRCSAWVAITSIGRHEAWHRSVDTDQTTDVSHPVDDPNPRDEPRIDFLQ